MKLTFILITLFINFLNPLLIKSEEKFVYTKNKIETKIKKKSFIKNNSKLNEIHIVQVGETISSISKLYSVDKNLIIKLNDLKDENYIYVGQNLVISSHKLPSQTNLDNKETNIYHIVKHGENLTEISNIYSLKLEYLIEINNLKNPDSIKVGKKLIVSKNNPIISESFSTIKDKKNNELININKKTYGPLVIQSKQFKTINGRKVLRVLNQSNKKLFISIRCETEELDVRLPRRKWRGWKPGNEIFEKNLINDICKQF